MINEWTKTLDEVRAYIKGLEDINGHLRDRLEHAESQLEAADKTIVELRRDRDYLRSIVDIVGGRG